LYTDDQYYHDVHTRWLESESVIIPFLSCFHFYSRSWRAQMLAFYEL